MTGSIRVKASMTALAAVLALAGCERGAEEADNAQLSYALPDLPATLPLTSGIASPISFAPDASALPDVDPIGVAQIADPTEAYGFADAAYTYTDTLGDAPPDYGFDYDGVEPWAWQGYDDSLMFAEPIDDGYRTYYYRPGAAEPYFIRDPYYSYGFAGGLLAVIYAADGGIVPFVDYGPRRAYASRYYLRGRDLYGASRRGRRLPIHAVSWAGQRPIILASRNRWAAGRAHQPAWGAYHNANLARQQRYWREEAIRRRADSRRFGEWRQAGFRSNPPPRAIPPRWADARWARDEKRYRPASDQVREAVIRDRRQDAQQDRRETVAERRIDQRQQVERRDDRRDDARQQVARERNATVAGDRGEVRRQQADRQDRADDRARAGQRQQDANRIEQRPGNSEVRRDAAREQTRRAQAERRESQREPTRAQRQPTPERAQRPQGDQQAERRQQTREQAERGRNQARERAQAERAQRQAAERQRQVPPQRQQAQRAQERQQAQAQATERAQRQQAQQAGRQQAQQQQQQTQRRQAEQQASQARQPAQPQPQAERQQARQQRQEDRPNRRDRNQ